MSLRHPVALLAAIALTACGPEFEGLEPTDTLDSVESGMTTQACTTTSNLLLNPGFESGNVRWTAPSGVIASVAGEARTGSWRARMAGRANGATTHMKQTVSIPTGACTITLRFFLKVTTTEPNDGWVVDTLQVSTLDRFGVIYDRLGWYDNRDAATTTYAQKSFTLDPAFYGGQTVTLDFEAYEDTFNRTSFFIDDVALLVTR